MKKLLLFLFASLAIHYSPLAQNTFPTSGNVGIGTTNPPNILKIISSTAGTYEGVNFQQASSTGIGYLGASNSDGNDLTIFVGSGAQNIRNFYGLGTGRVADISANGFDALALGTINPAPLVFGTANTGRLRIDANGDVSIGTFDAKGYKLAVAGSAVAESMTVKLQSNWPDYVFKPAYHLPSLTQIKSYIDKNGHLPEMPSEKEVAKEGINLGEMNKILTKKVEELTLYLIEQEKRIKDLESKINKQ